MDDTREGINVGWIEWLQVALKLMNLEGWKSFFNRHEICLGKIAL